MTITSQQIIECLQRLGYECKFKQATDENPVDILEIHFKIPLTDQRDLLRLVIDQPEMATASLMTEVHFSALRFYYSYPVRVKQEALLDTILLLNQLNKSFLLPGFGYDEQQRCPFFRYTSLVKNLDPDLLKETVESVITVLDTASEIIDLFSKGGIDFKTFLETSQSSFVDDASKTVEGEF